MTVISREVQQKLWRRTVLWVLILLALSFLIPVYMVIVTSLKEPKLASQEALAWDLPGLKVTGVHIVWGLTQGDAGLFDLPDAIHFKSYADAWEEFGPRLRNSFILAIGATVLSAMMGSLNGYVLAKWRMPGSNILFPLMLFGMFIPYQAILIPLFDFMRSIDLYGGLPGLILIHVVYGLPITTLIFRNFYVEIPTELLEAGAIDGAGFFKIYRHIIFPLSIPGFVVVVIWQFTQIWNEFLFAVTMTRPDAQPITVGLAQLAGGEAVKWNLPMAGAILAALPTLLVYIVLGRYFIRGLLAGSVKG